jgi:branched-chain amino acid transport system permease protein
MVAIFIRPQGLFGASHERAAPLAAGIAGLIAVAALPPLVRFAFPASEKYYLHLLIQIPLGPSLYRMVADGPLRAHLARPRRLHGIGAYVTAMPELRRLTPWLGIPSPSRSRPSSASSSAIPASACASPATFRAADLALTELVRLCIVGLRDYTGGSLGTQPARYGDGLSLYAMQFEPDRMLAYYIAFALWLLGLYVWLRVDASMDRYALDAASQDEDAAASVGIDVTREKLKITALSAALCALGGAVFAQYQMYIGPDTIAGLGLSLNIVFAVIAGGMWTLLGPTVGAVFTQVLAEGLRVAIQGSATLKSLFGNSALALDQMI